MSAIYESGTFSRRETLDVYLTNGAVKRLSRGGVVRDGNTYFDYIRKVESFTNDGNENSLKIHCQNVNSELGLLVASDLRLFDYAVADFGKIYQSVKNPALILDRPQLFRSVVSNAEITEKTTTLTLLTDIDSLIATVANAGYRAKCPKKYKNGFDCTSNSDLPNCGKFRLDCANRGKPWEFGGWEFFEEPTDSAPGSAGNSGGIGTIPCFGLETRVRLVSGDVRFGDLPVGTPTEPIYHYSFNELTGEIEIDEIEEVFEHETNGIFNLHFEHKTLSVTEYHRLFAGNGRWKPAKDFKLGDTMKFHVGEWADSRLEKIEWKSGKTLVRNLRSKKNANYLANDGGAHNAKANPAQTEAQF